MPRRFWSELVIEIALKAKFEKPVRTRVPLRLCRRQPLTNHGYGMKKKRFKDELRRSLIAHSLIPSAAAVFAVFLCAYAVRRHSLKAECGRTAAAFAAKINAEAENYAEFLTSLSCTAPARIAAENGYAAAFNEKLYRFLNAQRIKGTFYLADSTLTVRLSSEYASHRAKAGREKQAQTIFRHFLRSQASGIFLWYGEDGAFPDLYISRTLDDGAGAAAFAFSAQAVLTAAKEYDFLFALTDEFGRIYASNTALFNGSLGKADEAVLGKTGFIRRGGLSVYVRTQPLFFGELTLYAAKNVQADTEMFALLAAAAAGIFALVTLSIWSTARVIADKKTHLIDTIVQAFKEAADGNLQKRLDIQNPEEFAIIGTSYNSMLESLVNLMRINEERSKEAIAANLRQSESQFNAHFLFNTLETVRFMSRIQPSAVESIVMSLSSLLRYSIRQGSETVPLCEDIENVKHYLKILTARFGKRLVCTMRLPPDSLACRVPKLIFQPIIENSIKYGLEENERVHIIITAQTDKDSLKIKITDDGKGIPEGKREVVLDGIKQTDCPAHIGLYNVHRRLSLLFGKPYGITVKSAENQGTEVTLLLPRIQKQTDFIPVPADMEADKC